MRRPLPVSLGPRPSLLGSLDARAAQMRWRHVRNDIEPAHAQRHNVLDDPRLEVDRKSADAAFAVMQIPNLTLQPLGRLLADYDHVRATSEVMMPSLS